MRALEVKCCRASALRQVDGKAAEDFAKRNDVDPRDIRTRETRDGVELEIRRSSLDRRGLKDSGEGRRDGWS